MKDIKDMHTLQKFIETYYRNTQDPSEQSNRRFLKAVVRNMQISNCTVGKVKSIMKKLKNNDDKLEITDADIIAFLQEEENITRIQEESGLLSFNIRYSSGAQKYSGLDIVRAR